MLLRHFSIFQTQNSMIHLTLTPFFFHFKEYLQQAQDLVENESILLQTLGKGQVKHL